MDHAENTPRAPDNAREDGGTGFDRRTLVKGAAWSIPVVALAVAAPKAAAASTTPWDVSVASGCVLDVGGSALVGPGFNVIADPVTIPIPGVLSVTETATGTWNFTLPAPQTIFGSTDPTLLPGVELALAAFSLAYATAIVTATLVPAALALSGPKVGGDSWVSPTSVADFLSPPSMERTYSGTGLGRMVTMSIDWDIARNVTLNGLVPGDSTYWGYFGALVPPDVTSIPGYALLASLVPGFAGIAGAISPQLSLTAVGNWTDADNGNHALAALTNLFAFAC